jgi:mRNA interferase MazF
VGLARGEIWLCQLPSPDKRRPVLLLSRDFLIQSVRNIIVAPIFSTGRGTPMEVMLGVGEGLKHDSFANLAHLLSVRRPDLHRYVGTVGPGKMREVCRALNIACGCD